MRLLADENVDQPIVTALRASGHEVWCVAEQAPGMTDEEVITAANERSAVLVTSDKDFGELVFRQNRVSKGVLLLRLAGLSHEQKANLVGDAVNGHGEELIGRFSVLSSQSLRIRGPVDPG